MDVRYGLSPEERRDFRLLYGDPWFMVSVLLGHASRTPRSGTIWRRWPICSCGRCWSRRTRRARVRRRGSPLPELDEVFARIAAESDAIQDFGPELRPDRSGFVTGRGRPATIPDGGHARPEVLTGGGLVVHHYNRAGGRLDFDFATLAGHRSDTAVAGGVVRSALRPAPVVCATPRRGCRWGCLEEPHRVPRRAAEPGQ